MPWLSIEKFVRYSSFVTADCAYLSTHTVYQYKIQFFHYLGGIWPYWKMDTGKHHLHEILLLF